MSTRVTLTLHDAAGSALRAAATAPDEIAGVLIVGVSETPGEVRLLAREFRPAPAGAYRGQTPRRLRLSPEAYLPALSRAAALGAAAIFVHSHPEDDPVMSPLDDGVDEDLRSVFQIRTGSPLYGSLVLRLINGELSFSGRLWRGVDHVGAFTMVREVGARFRFTSAVDALATVPPTSVFDRQVLAFGPAMQALLGQLNIGVVGCGGTGSAVAEQLIRMGVGTLTVVDFDTLSDKNVTRVHGSTMDDVGLLKTEVLRRHAEAIGFGTTIVPIEGSAAERDVADALRACDIIFGCTDDHSGRLVLARLAYWFLIPVLDVGAKIEADEGTLLNIVTRLNVQVPGAACAVCWGAIDLSRAHAEHLTHDERRDLERDGYVPDLDESDPAVVTYTTLVASLAVHEMIGRLTGVLTHAASRVMFLGAPRQLSSAVRDPAPGHWCGKPSTWGAGMTLRFLDQAWPT